MAHEKSIDVQIADLDEQIIKLKAEKEALRIKTLPQYPKHVQVPTPRTVYPEPTHTVVVNSEAEEKAAFAVHHKTAAQIKADEKAAADKLAADKKAVHE